MVVSFERDVDIAGECKSSTNCMVTERNFSVDDIYIKWSLDKSHVLRSMSTWFCSILLITVFQFFSVCGKFL